MPSPSLEASVSSRNSLLKSGNTSTGAEWTLSFQDPSCFLCLGWQMHWAHLYLFPQHIIEGPCNVSKSLNKVPVMPHQPTKCMDLGVGLRHQKLLHCAHILMTGTDSVTQDMMCQVHNFQLEKQTLGWFQLQSELAKPFKYNAEMLQMFLLGLTKHYYIIEIDDAIGEVQLSLHVLHEMLESCWSIAEAERHAGEFIESQVANSKVVYCCESGAIFTCQNLLLKSIMEKCMAPAILSSASSIHARGYESFLVCVFNLQKSTQKHNILSFLQTKTTTLHHGDWLRWIFQQWWWWYASKSL